MTTDTNVDYYKMILDQRSKEISHLKDKIEILENKATVDQAKLKFFRRRALNNSTALAILALTFIAYIIITQ